MKKQTITLLTLLCVFVMPSLAQSEENEDLGGMISLDFSKKLFSDFRLSFEEEYRMRENITQTERFSHTLDFSYKPFKFLKAGVAYNLIQYNHPEHRWQNRHRYYVYLTGDYSFGRFNLSLRERFQHTQWLSAKNNLKQKIYLRNRLQLEYDIKKSPFEPYASVEFYYALRQSDSNNRWRYTAGTAYKINKKNTLDFFYRYTNYPDPDKDDENGHMIGIAYSLKF